ncbi:LOW QUALITY PROTEIN: putative pre-mRNA-splicing factor ATP-dependent RNA helicase DHX32 [Liasis olivaceus]
MAIYTSSIQKYHFVSALGLLFEVHNSKERGDVMIFLACEQHNHFLLIMQDIQYGPRIRADTVVIQPISKNKAEMLANSGQIFRLKLNKTPLVKIQQSNLTSMVLFLKIGLGPCDFIGRLSPESLMQALQYLDYLTALDNDASLLNFGTMMSEFHIDPQLSKVILVSCKFGCFEEMLAIAVMVTIFLSDDTEKWCQGYFLNCSVLRTAEAIKTELGDNVRQIELPISAPILGQKENVLNTKALLSGYFMQVRRTFG